MARLEQRMNLGDLQGDVDGGTVGIRRGSDSGTKTVETRVRGAVGILQGAVGNRGELPRTGAG